jgi:hypothetical protein
MTRLVALLALLACLGCIRPPGEVKELRIVVGFAELDPADIGGISSFHAVFSSGVGVVDEQDLNFNATERTLSFLSPPALPAGEDVTVTLSARDVTGQPLPFGGSGGPGALSAVGDGGAIDVRVLIGERGELTPLGVDLEVPRFLAGAAATPTGLLVVGGATSGDVDAPGGLTDVAEWIDAVTGETCTADTCAMGDSPSARVSPIALRLADGFGADCPSRDAVLVGLGEDGAGALDDLYLFDEAGLDGGGAFSALAVEVTARGTPMAYATVDCRVVIAGGPASVDVLDFSGGDVTVDVVDVAGLSTAGALVPLQNGLNEALVLGDGAPFALGVASGSLSACDLGGVDGCNGAPSTPRCARARPSAARLVAGAEALVLVGGDPDGSCAAAGQPLELVRSAGASPFHAFVSLLSPPTVERRGGELILASGGDAYVIGGLDVDGVAIADVERVSAAHPGDGTDPADATFTVVGDTGELRAFAAGFTTEHNAFVVGGWSAGAPRGSIEVLTPAEE